MPAKPVQTISEKDVRIEAENGRVSGGRVVETSEGFQLVFTVAGRERYLATRREPDKPRVYRIFERLTALYRSIYPDGTDQLRFEHKDAYTLSSSVQALAKKKARAKKKAEAKARKKSATKTKR